MAPKKQDHDARQQAVLSAKSAFKSLELVLYQLSHHIKVPVQHLLGKSSELDNDARFSVSQIKESLDNLEYLLKATLKEKSIIAEGDFAHADENLFEKVQVDTVLRALATTTSTSANDEFYQFCVKTMAELYRCRFAFIGFLQPNGEDVQTLAVWAGDDYAENFVYNLEGTPCAEILTFNKELIPTGASKLYPTDELLVQMGVDSYFGAPILSREKGVLGLISVMDTKPMQPTEWTAPVLGVFAARLALEIERKQAMENLTELNNHLEERIKDRTRALQTANEELKAFSYSVSHDLRTPIRVVNSFTGILQEDHGHELSEQANTVIDRIKHAGKRLDSLTTDLLSLAKISNSELTIQQVELSKMVKDIVTTLVEQSPERKYELIVEPNIKAWGDEKLLRIALENMLSNAWKYTQNNKMSKIEFGTLPAREHTTYFIKDNGVGFDEAFMEKLFLPFERLHSDDKFEGSGIGLATTQRVIHRHSGEVWATSDEGAGACFFFNLGKSTPIKTKHPS